MKSFAALILLVGFTWTQFYNSGVLAIYELNKTEFIQAFCENQGTPELKCNGKCHLTKQLVDTKKNTDNPKVPNLIPEQELFSYSLNEEQLAVLAKEIAPSNFNPIITSHYIKEIDHPPRA